MIDSRQDERVASIYRVQLERQDDNAKKSVGEAPDNGTWKLG